MAHLKNIPRFVITLAIGLCLSWSSVATAQRTPGRVTSTNWAAKMFANTEHDFRTVGRGTSAEYHFEFENIYREDVHVAAVRTSCGCTTPTLTSDLVGPNQRAAVVATLNTKTHIGTKAATITVVFDKPSYAEVRLKVQGHIRTDITFDPPEVDFGQFDAGLPQSREVVITRTGNPNWSITDVRSHCENLKVKLSAPQRSGGMTRYRMQVDLDGDAPEGDLRHRLTLVSNDTRFPTTEMAINGQVRSSLSISPSAVGMGSISPNGQSTKRLVVRGKEPFSIIGVECPDERLSFDLPLGKKKLHMVTMRYTGDGGRLPIANEIKVVSDLPGEKTAKCFVTGTIR